MSISNISILLGAGFSKSLFSQFPSMKELTQLVFEDEEVKGLLRQLDVPGSIFEGKNLNEVNIENWLQILDESSAYLSDRILIERRQLVVKAAMDVISRKIQYVSSNLEFIDEDLNLIKKLIQSGVNILTTNYDLIFECAIAKLIEKERISVQTPYDLIYGAISMAYQVRSQTYLSASSDNNELSQIFKLHGSCDWYVPEGGNSEEIFADTSLISWETINRFALDSHLAIQNYSPLLAGPNRFKRDSINSTSLKPIWVGAYKALRNTNLLFVFGSSLHTTDSTLNSLIVEGLPVSPRIMIFDQDPEPIYERMTALTHRGNISVARNDQVNFKSFVELICAYSGKHDYLETQ